MLHPLGSPFVRDQLALRAYTLNEKRTQPDGDFILYWMQSTQRLEENWGLRLATREADRLGRPLVIYHGLSSTYAYASDRFHFFILESAREIARRAADAGLVYRFAIHPQRDAAARTLDRIALRACEVLTDYFPSAGVAERTALFAERAPCRVVAVDSVGVVPATCFPREEYAARTIRPKLQPLVDVSLEPVEDRPPKRPVPSWILDSLDTDWLDLERADFGAEIAQSDIDHSVMRAPVAGGLGPARQRLEVFLADGLSRYGERRRDPSDDGGSSRLSPYLHFGQISAAEIARAVVARGPHDEGVNFLNEMLIWRELALNFCLRNPQYRTLGALPDWVRRSMKQHESDARPVTYSREELERGLTYDELWNAGQNELVSTGQMHNVVRMLWGKSVVTWTARYDDALSHLIHLNDKYALDGRDPNSYAGIQWCFGKFDRPFAARPVWGTIRPMSLERARRKEGMEAYIRRWAPAMAET